MSHVYAASAGRVTSAPPVYATEIDHLEIVARRNRQVAATFEKLLTDLRKLFPATYAEGSLPDRPTRAAPGTEDKIRVLCQRVKQRLQLHHPRDRRLESYQHVCVMFEGICNGRKVNSHLVSKE
jgi:hypothetical protein